MASQMEPATPKVAGVSIAVLVALASMWLRQHHPAPSSPITAAAADDDRARIEIELEVANGWTLRRDAVPSTLTSDERRRFALVTDDSYRIPGLATDRDEWYKTWRGVVEGGAGWASSTADGAEPVRSPWAVWTTGEILSKVECTTWIQWAEDEGNLETGDFVFAGGKWGHSRVPTGARRHSATRMVVNEEFAALLTKRLSSGQGVPTKLADGREYCGVGTHFLVSKYVKGQYFAPHFDGRHSAGGVARPDGSECVAEFTVVLYLTDDFEGGATLYLPGQGSEVADYVAVRPARGSAVIHRQGTVLHSGGALLDGTKYIMQVGLCYEAPATPEPRPITNLRWGA